MATTGDTLNIRFNQALALPLQHRCEQLAIIFAEYGNKELQMVLPHLLENLFGLTNHVGWGLRTIYRNSQPREFEILFRFLEPNGPIFRLCYKLLTESSIKYEFPIAYLPVKVRKSMEDGMIPPFYADKLQIDPQTRIPTSLVLNSFEYYIFHFAYHLVNPWLQRPMDFGAWGPWETPYTHLSEEYLIHFLPCDGSAVPPYAGGFMHPKSSLPLQATNRPTRSPTLFRQSVILKQSTASSSLHSSPTLPQQSSLVEIWRSESVIQVFIDFWLNCGEKEKSQFGAGTPSRDFLPTIEHIRVVRNLIKHLHYFASSIVGDMSAMDELKRIILPSSQSKIYGFLRHTINHWPLDSSFRLILETWLSYIQPWRYTDWRLKNTRSVGGRESEERVRVVDNYWQNFIAENLLSYTVIFRQLLPRFMRLDLATPKNAHMLFRVTKVISQPNLNRMLMEVENCLDDVPGQNLPNSSRAVNLESSHQGHKWNALVRQQMLELEGPGYQYKPMFGTDTVSQVFQFMLQIQMSIDSARNLIVKLERETSDKKTGFFSSLYDFFFSPPLEVDEYSMDERKKVIAYLETCLGQLSNIFDIDRSRLPCMSYSGTYEIPHCSTLGATTAQQEEILSATPPSPISSLAPREWKARRKHIKYEGDPDLEPIRTNENAFLVKLLYHITSKLNEMYTLEMCHLYEHRGLLGCIARQVLSPPMVARTFDKSKPGFSPQVETILPPRLSLRSFASHKSIVYLLIGLLFCWLLGYGLATYVVILLIFWIVWTFLKVLYESIFGRNIHRLN